MKTTTPFHLFALCVTLATLSVGASASPNPVRPRQYHNSGDDTTATSDTHTSIAESNGPSASAGSGTSASTSAVAQEPTSNSSVVAVQPNSQGWYPYGCYTDCANGDQANRGLPVWVYTDASNGPEKCIKACAEKGYAIAGLQYHEQCWCGNSLGGQPTSDEECKYTCQDNQNACGGDCRQNVWSYNPPGTADTHI
ncbi:hypothetical protein IAT40_007612 [Kwoniella sp. CBS 6097]